jgi:SWI/SNF-related matrix-associated actin-dependent regulator 1 of chromatin subfamily A
MSEREQLQRACGVSPVTVVTAKRPDWYTVSGLAYTTVAGVPGIQVASDGRLELHRSHMPLLADVTPAWDAVGVTLRNRLHAERATFDARTAQHDWILRAYQHEAREFILGRKGAFIGDQPRLGKTAEIVSAHELSDGPLVVVGPIAARAVWINWFAKRWPDVAPVVVRGKRYSPEAVTTVRGEQIPLGQAQLVFLNYDILSTWQFYGRAEIGTLVFDEPHVLSNRRSNRSEAALVISSRAERIVLATGTPLWNRPAGLWTLLSTVNPGAWGKWFPFAERYCAGHPGAWGYEANGASNVEEFRARLAEVFLRRTWREVRPELPSTERTIETVEISEAQGYDLEVAAFALREAAGSGTVIGALARFRRLLGAHKVKAAVEAACRVLDNDESVVVWAWHRDVVAKTAQELQRRGYRALTMTGEDDGTVREAVVATFASEGRGNPIALVATIGVGQTAIDLSAARHCVFVEVDFTPAVISQAEMRTFSPDRPMTVCYIVAEHEIDRMLVETLSEKCALAERMGLPAADTPVEVIGAALGVQLDEGDLSRLQAVFLEEDFA